MSGKHPAVLLSLVLLLQVACAGTGTGTGTGERSRYVPPNYASVVGDGNFEVRCGMSRIYVMRASIQNFRKPDGSSKTRAEFCEPYWSNTNIDR